jgi:hypothetical protein
MTKYNELQRAHIDYHTDDQEHVENPEISIDRSLGRKKIALVDIEAFKSQTQIT